MNWEIIFGIELSELDNKMYEFVSVFSKPKILADGVKVMYGEEVRFTRRETECLIGFLQGYTSSQTAKLLGLSPRTIEFYTKNMRTKMNCCTKRELVKLVRRGEVVAI